MTKADIEKQLEMERGILAVLNRGHTEGSMIVDPPPGIKVRPYINEGQENRVRALEIMLEEWQEPAGPVPSGPRPINLDDA
jgi:hypothetical protein